MPHRSRPAAGPGLKSVFCCATALGGLTLGQPAMAQTDAQIRAIEQQIKAAADPTESGESEPTTRDHALKAAQEQAKAAQDQAAAAAGRGRRSGSRSTQTAASAPPAVPPPGPPLPPGSFPGRRLDRHVGRLRGARRYLSVTQRGLQHRHQLRQHSIPQQP